MPQFSYQAGPEQRKIIGFMAIAVIFALIGDEIDKARQSDQQSAGGTEYGSAAKIVLGGTIAAGLLSLIAETSEAGADFALGLAGTALLTALLVKGGAVWTGINNLLGNKTGNTTPTGATTGTGATGATGTVPATTPT